MSRYILLTLLFMLFCIVMGCEVKHNKLKNPCEARLTKAKIAKDSLRHYYQSEQFTKALEWSIIANKEIDSCKLQFPVLHAMTHEYIGQCQFHLDDHDSALESHYKALSLRREMEVKDSIGLTDSHNNLGIVYLELWEFDSTFHHFGKALEVSKQYYGDRHRQTAQIIHNIGLTHYQRGDYKQSLDYYNRALDIDKEVLPEFDGQLAYDYMSMAILYDEIGEYHKAIDLYNKALRIRMEENGPNSLRTATVMSNLGASLTNIGEFKTGEEYYLESLNIRERAPDPPLVDISATLNNLGLLYMETNQIEEALFYLYRSLSLRKSTHSESLPLIAESYQNLRLCYQQLGKLDSSLYYAQKAYTTIYAAVGYHPITSTYAKGLAEEYADKGEIGRSHGLYDTALYAVNFINDTWEDVTSLKDGFLAIDGKAHLIFKEYLVSKDIRYLKQAQALIEEALEGIHILRRQLRNLGSRETLFQQTFLVFEHASQIYYALYQESENRQYLRKMFELAEQTKAISLREAMYDAQAIQHADIPTDLLSQEHDLSVELSYLESTRQEIIIYEEGEFKDSLLRVLGYEMATKREKLDDLIRLFEEEYPKYHQLKYDFDTPSIEEVQKDHINENQTLVEYFLGDSVIYIFMVDKHEYIVHEIERTFPLSEWVQSFRMATHREEYTRRIDDYVQSAHQLYVRLIKPLEGKLKNELIIIPDGELGYISFEALLTAPVQRATKWKNHPYLLRERSISYNYSSALLKEMLSNDEKEITNSGVLAFAPYYYGDTSLQKNPRQVPAGYFKPLPHSGDEILEIIDIAGGDSYFKEQATKLNFKELAGSYRFIHLASHGHANNSQGELSYIVFSHPRDSLRIDPLYVGELYNLELTSEMVVLTACESGTGQMKQGEGIFSIARGFSYAGAKSIISTLWSVGDVQSKELMISFYKHLVDGKSKSEALRKSKLEFMASARLSPDAHPFYWSGFIAMGDTRPVRFK